MEIPEEEEYKKLMRSKDICVMCRRNKKIGEVLCWSCWRSFKKSNLPMDLFTWVVVNVYEIR